MDRCLAGRAAWLPWVLDRLRWLAPAVALVVYTLVVVVALPGCDLDMIREDCPHLALVWWEGCLSGAALALYMTVTVLAFVLLLPPWWAVVNLTIWAVTLMVSRQVYECGVGSMWCWMVAFASVAVLVAALVFDQCDYPRRPGSPPSVVELL